MKRISYIKSIIEQYSYDTFSEYQEHKRKLESEGYDLLSDSYYEDKGMFEAKYEKVLEWETE